MEPPAGRTAGDRAGAARAPGAGHGHRTGKWRRRRRRTFRVTAVAVNLQNDFGFGAVTLVAELLQFEPRHGPLAALLLHDQLDVLRAVLEDRLTLHGAAAAAARGVRVKHGRGPVHAP